MKRAAGWIGLAIALCGLIAVELQGQDRVHRQGVSPALPVPPAAAAATPEADGEAAFAGTSLARPLFTPSRSPPMAATAATAQPALPRLGGIMVTPTEKAAVFIPDDGQPIITRQGGQLDGYTVETVTADAVTVRGPNGLSTLHIAYGKGGPVLATPAAPALPAILGITGTPGGIWTDNGKLDLPNAATWPGLPPIGNAPLPDLAPPSAPLPTAP